LDLVSKAAHKDSDIAGNAEPRLELYVQRKTIDRLDTTWNWDARETLLRDSATATKEPDSEVVKPEAQRN